MKVRIMDETFYKTVLINLEQGRAKMIDRKSLRKPSQPFRTEVSLANLEKTSPERKTYSDQDAESFLVEIQKGRAPIDIAKDFGRPSTAWWRLYLENHPSFKARADIAMDALPFGIQARIKTLGEKFRVELRKLFDLGYSDQRAAEILGVTAMTSNRVTKAWRQERSSKI